MNESPIDPAHDRSGIGEAVSSALRQPSFLRVMLFLAATVVVLTGMRLGSPVLSPILFAVVLSLLFSPIYSWLKRHRIPTPLALLLMLVGLSILFGGSSSSLVSLSPGSAGTSVPTRISSAGSWPTFKVWPRVMGSRRTSIFATL